MKYLTICRHAKASWPEVSQKDFDRTLNSRGKSNALEMGKFLFKQNLQPDYLLSSSAIRAQETAEIIAKELRLSSDISLEPQIYEATVADLQSVIETLPDDKSDVMLFGHNPSLESLCNYIHSGSITTLTTCNIAQYQLDIEQWKDFGFSCGKLTLLTTPKNLGLR